MASAPSKWNYDRPPMLPLFLKIGILANDLYSSQLPPETALTLARFFSLYWFILCNLNVPDAELRMRITDNGLPIFKPVEMAEAIQQINAQADTPFARRLLAMTGIRYAQAGGKNTMTVAVPGTAAGTVPPATTPSEGDDDPSRSKFWDVFFRKRLYNLTKGLPPSFDTFAPIIFSLYGAEQIQIVGPLIASGLDTITLGLPILGKLLGTSFAKIVSLAPIPYAGPVGDIVAYFIALVFIMLSATMSVSRKQFGTSFTIGVGAVPVIGDNLSDAALLFEKQVERYEFNKKRLLGSLEEVSPHAAEFFNYYLPGAAPKTGPPPPFDWDMIFLDVLKKATEGQDTEAIVSALPFPKNLPLSVKEYVGEKKKGGRRRTRKSRR